jgi:hypothetical protein
MSTIDNTDIQRFDAVTSQYIQHMQLIINEPGHNNISTPRAAEFRVMMSKLSSIKTITITFTNPRSVKTSQPETLRHFQVLAEQGRHIRHGHRKREAAEFKGRLENIVGHVDKENSRLPVPNLRWEGFT